MKVYALVRESSYSFDHETTIELFATKELAKAAFDEAVKEVKEQYNERDYEWIEEESCFSVYKAGFAEEYRITIEEKKLQGVPRLEIPAGREGDTIVVEADGNNLPVLPEELAVCLVDRHGRYIQNIALIRPQHKSDGDGFIATGDTEVFVWGDAWNEDFTDAYIIPRAEVEE